MSLPLPSKDELLAIRTRIATYIHRTPVLASRLINKLTGGELFFKCENFQRMGAFKMRGASHAVAMLSDEAKHKGVVTHSSGNFAQALALAAGSAGIPAYIVMPQNAPAVKKAAVREYGGNIIESENSPLDREARAAQVQRETGAAFIHPSNDWHVILGNATAASELIDEIPGLDMIVAPVGGGGLIAGTALAAAIIDGKTEVTGAEPAGADDAYRSLQDGVIYPSVNPDTICDGLRTNLGDVNFPVIQKYVREILVVDDQDTVEAMKLIMGRMKIVVEPSAAIALAAVLTNQEQFRNRRAGIIFSGGNVDLTTLGRMLI